MVWRVIKYFLSLWLVFVVFVKLELAYKLYSKLEDYAISNWLCKSGVCFINWRCFWKFISGHLVQKLEVFL
ncbi:hypothetical protein RchiOBHm_Chr4g0390461 [Rosa chinensis]|uniref:Uncharacterized protein n=1 Tax=Rosa chinensis TaxID=74649 RepID=A0A2P6QQC5_ROSCH|nr:hypothetical protein RchiOBHm_Chr4g0390461 [Rosa chinensis]